MLYLMSGLIDCHMLIAILLENILSTFTFISSKKKKKRHLVLDSFNRLPIKLQFVIMINYTLPIIGYLYYPFDLREVLYLTYFYNKFRCSVVIGSNLNPSLKLIFCPPVIVYHLRFIVKLL